VTGVRQKLDSDRAQALQGAALFDSKAGLSSLEQSIDKALSGSDPVAARRALERLDITMREKVFATRMGDKRLPPVLDAARRGMPHMAALFAGMGASLGVQNAYGFTALHVAYDYNQTRTARAFLASPYMREALIDTSRVSTDWVREKLAAMPDDASDDDLDNVAISITDGERKQLTTTDRMGIYVAHINDMDNSPSVFDPNGWNPEAALEMRIRTLVGWIAAAQPQGEKRDTIVREIAINTEALQLERRVRHFHGVDDVEATRLGLEHECEGLIRKLEAAARGGNPQLTRLLVPVSTPKHSMYMELRPIYFEDDLNQYVLVQYDNLGYGNGAHPVDGKKVHPLCVVVPLPLTAAGERADGLVDLKEMLIGVLSERRNGTVENVYQAIYAWMSKALTHDIGAVRYPRTDDAPSYPQAAGNCTIANLMPSTIRRLGELAEEFIKFEHDDAFRRETMLGSPARRQAAIEKRRAELLAKRSE
jgi:hypothetical protein